MAGLFDPASEADLAGARKALAVARARGWLCALCGLKIDPKTQDWSSVDGTYEPIHTMCAAFSGYGRVPQ
jgi:hypothetical protein